MEESANDRFEKLAALFYDETGMLPPGKDDASGDYSREERTARWIEWNNARHPSPTQPPA